MGTILKWLSLSSVRGKRPVDGSPTLESRKKVGVTSDVIDFFQSYSKDFYKDQVCCHVAVVSLFT